MRSPRLLALVVALIVASAAAAWFVAAQVQSPAQVAAQAEPPPPAPVLTEVRVGPLRPPITVSLTAASAREGQIVAPAESLGKFVTATTTEAGDTLASGDVLLRLNGRPVFVLGGRFPMYRPLAGGSSGDDVIQLQQALNDAGFAVQADGDFGNRTKAALEALYQEAGYAVPREDDAAVQRLRELRAAARATPASTLTEDEKQELSRLELSSGPQALPEELVFSSDLPATASSVAAIGSQSSSETPLATLESGQQVLRQDVPASAAAALSVEASGTVVDDTGTTRIVTLTSITPSVSDADQTTLSVSPEAGAALQAGTSYTVTFPDPANAGSDNLLIPATAIVSRDSASFVYVEQGGNFIEVAVRQLGEAGAVVAVEPVDAGADLLVAGVQVRLDAN